MRPVTCPGAAAAAAAAAPRAARALCPTTPDSATSDSATPDSAYTACAAPDSGAGAKSGKRRQISARRLNGRHVHAARVGTEVEEQVRVEGRLVEGRPVGIYHRFGYCRRAVGANHRHPRRAHERRVPFERGAKRADIGEKNIRYTAVCVCAMSFMFFMPCIAVAVSLVISPCFPHHKTHATPRPPPSPLPFAAAPPSPRQRTTQGSRGRPPRPCCTARAATASAGPARGPGRRRHRQRAK